MRLRLAFAGAALATFSLLPAPTVRAEDRALPEELTVYVGTYTSGPEQGIFVCRLNMKTGTLTKVAGTGLGRNPSFVAVHPSRKFLYAVNEIPGDNGVPGGGGVSGFAIDPKTGLLSPINDQSSAGAGPCHLVVDATGQVVLVANYGGGSVASLPLREDGKLMPAATHIQHEGSSVNQQRQEKPHAHSINVDPGNRFAVAADLGTDKVYIYKLNAKSGTLSVNDPPFASVTPGAGPRHFAFHPGGKFTYVINELDSTVTAFAFNGETGALKPIQTVSTLPAGFAGNNTTAEVQVHPSGRFLYGSNRGHNSLAIFSVDAERGTLTAVGHEPTQGKIPRNFGIDPTGHYILACNQDSDTIVVFRVDLATGKLQATGSKIEIPKPVCVKFVDLAS